MLLWLGALLIGLAVIGGIAGAINKRVADRLGGVALLCGVAGLLCLLIAQGG